MAPYSYGTSGSCLCPTFKVFRLSMRACVGAWVRAWVRGCVCACVRAWVRGCVRACVRACAGSPAHPSVRCTDLDEIQHHTRAHALVHGTHTRMHVRHLTERVWRPANIEATDIYAITVWAITI